MQSYFLKLKRTCTHLTKVATAEAKSQAGVFGAQAQALLKIAELDGCKISELSHHLELGKSGLTTLVDRLEKQDLVIRESDPDDARATILRLTNKGVRTHGSVLKMVDQLDSRLIDGFSENEIKIIDKFLMQAARL